MVVTVQRHLDTARHVNIETTLLLLLVYLVFLEGRTVHILYTHIIRYTREVVLINETDLLRETEDNLTFYFLLRTNDKHLLNGIARRRSREECQENLALFVNLIDHTLQLLLVLRHILCLTSDELLSVLLQFDNLLNSELSHLGRATG